MFKFIAILIMMFTFSCTKKMGPEETLADFINYRFKEDVQSKGKILEYLGGALAEKIKNMDKEEFDKFSNMKDRKKKKFKIIYKNCDEKKCTLTYVIGQDLYKNKEKQFSVEVKKIAELQLVESKWKIVEVSTSKTHIDILDEIKL